MSFEDVIPILNALKGKGMPASDLGPEWLGGLGFYGVEYFIGPSEVDLRLMNDVNTRVMPIWSEPFHGGAKITADSNRYHGDYSWAHPGRSDHPWKPS
jgi:hypothetical protein